MNEEKSRFLDGIVSMLPDCISLSVKRFIASQFALESNFGSSPMSLCNNNYSGMKVAKVRLTLAKNLEEAGKFAVFTGIYSCVLDYLLWLQYNKFSRAELNDLKSFVHHIDISGYCNDLGYLDRIQSIYHQYSNNYE